MFLLLFIIILISIFLINYKYLINNQLLFILLKIPLKTLISTENNLNIIALYYKCFFSSFQVQNVLRFETNKFL